MLSVFAQSLTSESFMGPLDQILVSIIRALANSDQNHQSFVFKIPRMHTMRSMTFSTCRISGRLEESQSKNSMKWPWVSSTLVHSLTVLVRIGPTVRKAWIQLHFTSIAGRSYVVLYMVGARFG